MLDRYISCLKENICLSGGAKGADSQWGMMAGRIGHQVIHWGFDRIDSIVPEQELIILNDKQLDVADFYLRRANETLRRSYPTSNTYVNKLLKRSYYQIAWSDKLYAVGFFNDDYKIDGGTSWAVQMMIDMFEHHEKKFTDNCIYFFDQRSRVWYTWNNKWILLPSRPPVPSGIWAGIGTRKLDNFGKWEIRNLMGGYDVGMDQIKNIFPTIINPKYNDKIYVPTIKEIGRGIDDKIGGISTVSKIQNTEDDIYISVLEFGNFEISWNSIKNKQNELREEFGLSPAHLKPDNSSENNTNIEYYRI